MPYQPKDEQLAVVLPSDIAKIDRRAVELVRISFNLWEISIPAISLINRFKDKKNFHPKMQPAYRWLCFGRLATFARQAFPELNNTLTTEIFIIIVMLLEAAHRYPHENRFLKPEGSVGLRHRKAGAFACEPMNAVSEKRWLPRNLPKNDRIDRFAFYDDISSLTALQQPLYRQNPPGSIFLVL